MWQKMARSGSIASIFVFEGGGGNFQHLHSHARLQLFAQLLQRRTLLAHIFFVSLCLTMM